MFDFREYLKKTIRNPYKLLGTLVKRIKFINHNLSDETYLKIIFRSETGNKLNLDNPKTFNEKIQWMKIHDRKPEYTKMVDKYEVKQYVAEKIGEQYIIPTLGVWDKFSDIDFSELPDKFVLKCTHDSGGLVICRNKKEFDVKEARRKINKALKKNFYWIGREWPYKDVKPRIIAEKLMEDGKNLVPEDYKMYCFNGKPEYIVVFHNRFNTQKQLSETVYNINWEPQQISFDNKFAVSNIIEPKPECLDELLRVCEIICKGHPQLRVDFYIIDNKIYFGEITFSTANGTQGMIPEEMDSILGEKIILPSIE